MSYSGDARSSPRPVVQVDGRIVIARVAEFYNITMRRIVGQGRTKWVVRPRQVAMWICRNVLAMSFPDVGRIFDRDHTTVMQACDRVSHELRSDSKFADELDQVVRFIDPKHRILETTYRYVCNDEGIEDLPAIAIRIMELALEKKVNTVAVTFQLLRGSPFPLAPGQERLRPTRQADGRPLVYEDENNED